MPGEAARAATAFEVSPIRIVLSQDQLCAAVHVHSQGDEQVVIQMQLASWKQQDGQDVYGPAEELAVSPPIYSLKGDEEQIVRVALIDPPRDWGTERSYRLFVHQVPPPPDADTRNVRLALRISVPVFVLPKIPAKPTLRWHLDRRPGRGLWMTVTNSGNVHALVMGVQLSKASAFAYETVTHKYVLPGSTVSWRLDEVNAITAAMPDSVELIATTDQGVYKETLPIEK